MSEMYTSPKEQQAIHAAATSQGVKSTKKSDMTSTRQKLKHLHASAEKVEAFAAAGGDLKSQAATPVWMFSTRG
jgi:hypothetical protein